MMNWEKVKKRRDSKIFGEELGYFFKQIKENV